MSTWQWRMKLSLVEGEFVRLSVCTESITHQKENVSNMNWGGGRSPSPPFPTTLLLKCDWEEDLLSNPSPNPSRHIQRPPPTHTHIIAMHTRANTMHHHLAKRKCFLRTFGFCSCFRCLSRQLSETRGIMQLQRPDLRRW